MFVSRLVVVCFAMLLVAGCNKITGPSDATDPQWPGGDKWGEKPVLINQTYAVQGVTIFIDRMTPRENGTARVGQRAQIWAKITNNTGQGLVVRNSVSNGPSDRPGEMGDSSQLFNSSRMIIVNPGATRDVILGYDVLEPASIPWLRLCVNFFPSDGGPQIGPHTRPEGTLDIHLGWTLAP